MARTEAMTLPEERIAFYHELGLAIGEWSNVENALRYLVLACFENRGDEDLTHRALSVGFLSVETAKARIDFAEGVVARKFGAHEKEWAALVAKTRITSGLRNRLAHWPVRELPLNSPGRRVLLVPWVFEKPKKSPRATRPPTPNGSQALRDVVKMKLAFMALRCALENFCARLRGQKEPHPKAAEQPANPQSIAKLRGLILEGLARQLAPCAQKSGQKV